MSYVYAGDSPDHADQYLYAPGGLGILGSLVPATGEGGRPGLLYNDVVANGWQANQVRVFIVSASRPGLFVNDDSSWLWDSLVSGQHVAVQKVYVDGVAQPETANLILTVGGIEATGALADGGGDRMSGVAAVVAQAIQAVGTLADRGGDRLSAAVNIQPFDGSITTLTPGRRTIKAGTRTPVKLEPLDTAETDDLVVIFKPNLASAPDPILSINLQTEARSGTDPAPSPLVVGGHQVDDTVVLQRISGARGIAGVTYLIRVVATRVSGRQETASAFIKVLRKL